MSKIPFKKIMIYLFAGIGGLIAVVIIATIAQVDDWSRDLSQNRAETSPDAESNFLRPIESAKTIDEIESAVKEFVSEFPHWEMVGREHPVSQTSETAEEFEIKLTRTSKLFKFVDDVTLRITKSGENYRIDAVSQSRVGKGDLGQNPRNIKKLFAALKPRLDQ